MSYIRRLTSRTRQLTTREVKIKNELNKVAKISASNNKYTRPRLDFLMMFSSTLGLTDSLQPYNSQGGKDGQDFDSVKLNYLEFVHWGWTKEMIKLGYVKIEKEIEYIETVIKHMEDWLPKQKKKTQEHFKNYVQMYEYKCKELRNFKD